MYVNMHRGDLHSRQTGKGELRRISSAVTNAHIFVLAHIFVCEQMMCGVIILGTFAPRQSQYAFRGLVCMCFDFLRRMLRGQLMFFDGTTLRGFVDTNA